MVAPGATGSSPAVDADDLRTRYQRDGYVHVPGLIDADTCERLAEALATAPERDPGPNPLTLGTMTFRSNLFYGSTELQELLCSTTLGTVIIPLIGPDAWVRWDQAVWKHPGAPPFPLHQDNGYTGLTASHLQIWLALTPADRTNGGLVVVPGGHLEDLPHRWEGHHVVTEVDRTRHQIVADIGDVIAFSSRLPHETTPNHTDAVRLAYVAEYLPLVTPDPSVPYPHLIAFRDGRSEGTFEGDPAASPPVPTTLRAAPTGWRGLLNRLTRGRSDASRPPVGSDDARR